jgi:uncharacterized protein with PQ loop repeat
MDLSYLGRCELVIFFFFLVQSRVIKTKSVEYMPFLLSLVSFLNGCCWTAYALIRFDLYVTVSIDRL